MSFENLHTPPAEGKFLGKIYTPWGITFASLLGSLRDDFFDSANTCQENG